MGLRTRVTGDPLRQLAAEGVSLWLGGAGRREVASGLLGRLVRGGSVTGATGVFHELADLVATPAYRGHLAELASLGASAEQAARMLICHDLRAVCDTLLPLWESGRGADGQVCAVVGHTADAATAAAEARWLHWTVDRPNLLVLLPADAVGLAAMRRCLAEGIGVGAGPVHTEHEYQEVLAAWFDGLEQALAAGLPVHRIPSVVRVPVARVDAEVRAAASAAAGPLPPPPAGQAGIAVARVVFGAHERVSRDPRWRMLGRAGARVPRLVFGVGADSVPVYAGGLVSSGAVQELTEDGLRQLTGSVVLMEGDTLSGRRLSARDDLERLAESGVRWPELARDLRGEAPRRRHRAWRAVVDAVARELALAGR
ncbi:transaldolase family protein [Streptomyces sp. NPDC012888]|uniref:transaldolase family protein n=1 Tax=Streptomyces sp. NPDC012888 TaxID=3364855 RepID=UPI0036A9DCCB